MKIKNLMIPDPITITEKDAIEDAIELMKVNAIRHLPVVAKNRVLKGLVTLADLKQGLIPSMVGDLTLNDLIIRKPITVTSDDDVEVAARLIYKHKIGGLPVVEGRKLVGIITETDILRAFIDMMGILTASSRIDVVVADKPGAFKEAARIVQDNGGDIINVGMMGKPKKNRTYSFRLFACKTGPIKTALRQKGFKVISTTD